MSDRPSCHWERVTVLTLDQMVRTAWMYVKESAGLVLWMRGGMISDRVSESKSIGACVEDICTPSSRVMHGWIAGSDPSRRVTRSLLILLSLY